LAVIGPALIVVGVMALSVGVVMGIVFGLPALYNWLHPPKRVYTDAEQRIIAERSERDGATWDSCTKGL
jgi:hypothetical protein